MYPDVIDFLVKIIEFYLGISLCIMQKVKVLSIFYHK